IVGFRILLWLPIVWKTMEHSDATKSAAFVGCGRVRCIAPGGSGGADRPALLAGGGQGPDRGGEPAAGCAGRRCGAPARPGAAASDRLAAGCAGGPAGTSG